MSHVDEGALHAYLDGALDEYPAAEARRVREHLEACAVCAERLAVEKRIRDEADAILGFASPDVVAPSFEELRAYVRRTRSGAGAGAAGRLYRMGWAASVVLALGTGWLLRGQRPPAVLRDGSVATGATIAESPAAPDQPASTQDVAAQEAERELGRERANVQAEPAPRPATAPPAEPAGSAPIADLANTSSIDAPAVVTQPRQRDDDAFLDAADALARVPEPTASRLGAMPVPSAPPLVAGSGAAAPGVATDATGASSSALKAAEVTAPSAQAATRPEARRAASDQRLTSAISAEPLASGVRAASTPSDASNERRADDEVTSLVIPGLDVLAVLPVGDGRTFAGMRALQRLQSGDTLELVHLPQGVDPATLPPLPVGWSELVQRRGEGWLVMRAPVAPGVLAELLQRLEAPR